MSFYVELTIFRGPLELLCYLVRQGEVEIEELPVAPIAEQYLAHLAAITTPDVNEAGEFLGLASTLVEMKSQQLLPRCEENEEPVADSRAGLVQHLLEYKQYRDAASILEERGREWQQRWPRLAEDLLPPQRNPAEQPIEELELWDLVSAFARIVREAESTKPSSIVYDETPIQVFMARIHARVRSQGQIAFEDLFSPGMHRSTLVGIFLAVLELVRHARLRLDQPELFGKIWLLPGEKCDEPLDAAEVGSYGD
jgi:segregation and condensation protein A